MSEVKIEFDSLSNMCKHNLKFRTSHITINKCVMQDSDEVKTVDDCNKYNCPYLTEPMMTNDT